MTSTRSIFHKFCPHFNLAHYGINHSTSIYSSELKRNSSGTSLPSHLFYAKEQALISVSTSSLIWCQEMHKSIMFSRLENGMIDLMGSRVVSALCRHIWFLPSRGCRELHEWVTRTWPRLEVRECILKGAMHEPGLRDDRVNWSRAGHRRKSRTVWERPSLGQKERALWRNGREPVWRGQRPPPARLESHRNPGCWLPAPQESLPTIAHGPFPGSGFTKVGIHSDSTDCSATWSSL